VNEVVVFGVISGVSAHTPYGAADTNHPPSTHKWVVFDNVQQFIQVRKWLSGLPDPVSHGHARHHGHDRPEGKKINF